MKFLVRIFIFACLCISNLSCAHKQAPIQQDNLHNDSEILLRYWSEQGAPPEDYIIKQFTDHKWVFLGEYHRIKNDVDLVNRLIPLLHERTDVRCLALEFLNAKDTPAANRLITAKHFDRRKAIQLLKRQLSDWKYEEYINLFKSVWESNSKFLKTNGPFRFEGLSPRIDFETINFGTDQSAIEKERKKITSYDQFMARTLESRVLKPGHKALIYTGIEHAKAKYSGTIPRMGNRVYIDPYRGQMFFISFHMPFYDKSKATQGNEDYPFNGKLDRLMRSFERPIGFNVVHSPFAEIQGQHAPSYDRKFSELFDGYIIWSTPLKSTIGVTCAPDWVVDNKDFLNIVRNFPNKASAEEREKLGFEHYQKTICAPSPDFGERFKERFKQLPDIEIQK